MNGIDKIAGKIAADAGKEIESILAQAQSEAAAIAEKYAVQAKAESDKILASGQEQAKDIRRRADSAADQEAKQQLLATKQKMLTRAFDEALQKLLALPAEEYAALLAGLAAKAASSGSEEIILSAKDREALGQKVLAGANQLLEKAGKKAALTLSSETRPFIGGLLLKSGDVEVNCTLDTILRLSKEDLALEVAAALFA
ncbi:MAG: V-type ATP synthase subunit E [Clostridiales bacterium]